MGLHGRSIIAGEVSGEGSETFEVRNRLDGILLAPQFVNATELEVARAAEMAAKDFKDYLSQSGAERAAFLDVIAAEILALGDDLIHRARIETALPEARLHSERARTIYQLNAYAEVIREGSWIEAHIDLSDPDRKPLPKPDLRKFLVPLGPVAVFGSSNFPFAYSVAGGDTASALAAGCPVIVKAHPSHPGTSEMTANAITAAIRKCGMPAGVFSMINGNTSAVGMQLVNHPAINAVGFTGSLRGGRAIFNAASARPEPIPVYAEMGSTNPVFLLPGALSARGAQLADNLVQSMTLGVGQFCTSPGLVFAQNGKSLRDFTEAVRTQAANAAAGTMLSESIREAFKNGIDSRAHTNGVRVVSSPVTGGDPSLTGATVFAADARTYRDNELLKEENFGPSAVIVDCGSIDEMLAIARNLSGQLTATVHGTEEDLLQHRELLDILRQKAGRLIVNGFPTGVEVCPSMHHGGPYPATTDSRSTSVGSDAIRRFARPVCFQNFPDSLLPTELQNQNILGIWRLVDNQFTRADC